MSDNKKFIVYLTQGEYSDFGVHGVLVGDLDPTVVLAAWIDRESCGWLRWHRNQVCELPGDQKGETEEPPWRTNAEKWQLTGRLGLAQKEQLIASGFVEVEAVEVWLG